ncbi:VWA domain-containing protein, partial [Nitratireductor aquimarinus]|uniref:vWA domain-containing protein n=1 Tax=Nitratireductor aquimarinus TaxID=889300 RepID=UPI0029353A80
MKKGKAALIGWIVGATLWGASVATASEDVVIVYDASASMWGQIEGTAKMQIARDVMADLVEDWNSDTQLGLVAYGHRTEGDCSDIETLIAPGRLDKVAFIDHVNNIRPVGKTPLTAAVQHAAELLSYRDTPATVVLISDGVETCNADPCALSTELARQGLRFKAHVVGFDLDSEGQAELACIAQNTGGIFVPASNAGELTEALKQVQAAMTIPDEPALEAEPTSLNVTVRAPQEVTTGAV